MVVRGSELIAPFVLHKKVNGHIEYSNTTYDQSVEAYS